MKKLFVVTAISICSHSFAQDSTTLDEVTLTASKFSTKTTQTGKVVTIINRQDIEKAGSRDLAQVITEISGSFINGYSSNIGKEKNVYLRGAKVDHTLITIDGIPVYDATGIGSNFDLRNLSVDNIERIEILKGSQGTLYGSDAIAGVINIITRKNTNAGKPTVSHVMHYGSFNTFRSGTHINGRYKKLGYAAGFSHTASNGISEARKPENSQASFEKDAYRQNNLEAQLNWQAASQLSIQPFMRYGYFKGGLDIDAFQDEKDFENENHNLQLGLKNVLKLKKASIHLLYQFIHTKRRYLDDSLNITPYAYYAFNDERYKGREHFAETFLVYPFNSFRLTAGADFRASQTSSTSTQETVFFPGLTTNAFDGDSVRQQQVGFYAALNFQLKNFHAEAGGRYNTHSEYGNNAAFQFSSSYLVRERVKLYANISSGYKVPGLYQLFSLYGNTGLQPETSLNWEGGLQWFTANKQSYFRATYFNREVKDLIAFVNLPVYPYAQYANQDKQDDHGFELEALAKIGSRLQLRSNYNFVTGEVTTIQNGKDTSYFNLTRRPKSLFNFIAGFQATKALYFNVQVSHVGERQDVYFDPGTFVSTAMEMKPYTLLNFNMEFAINDQIRIFADIRNLLDEDYMDIYGYSTPGRNGYGGIRVKL